jgi:hypothetical protein
MKNFLPSELPTPGIYLLKQSYYPANLSPKTDNYLTRLYQFLQAQLSKGDRRSKYSHLSHSTNNNNFIACDNDSNNNSITRVAWENTCIESELKKTIQTLFTAIAKKNNQFCVAETGPHNISANKPALQLILKNMLFYVNEINDTAKITLEVFEDTDYMIILAEHKGNQLLRSKMIRLFQTIPAVVSQLSENLLQTCWHITKANGGWLTTGERNNGNNYISIALPKI